MSGLFADLVPAFLFTFAQAFASAALALVLGLIGALGLEWLRAKSVSQPTILRSRFFQTTSQISEFLALLPNVAPVLVFIFAMMRLAPSLRGFSGIVVAHAFLNSGLVSVALVRIFNDKLAGLSELAWIEGASRWQFVRRVAGPLLRSDLTSLFLFVFALSFASFSVPLMLGGSQGTTLEVLIWQKIRIGGEWGHALLLAAVQFLSLMALAFVISRGRSAGLKSARSASPLLSSVSGWPVAIAPGVFVIVALFDVASNSMKRAMTLPGLTGEVAQGLVGSFMVAVMTGLIVIAILMALAYFDPKGWLRKVLLGAVAPSAVITGFAILFVWRETGFATHIKIALGLALVTTPAFYRLRWDGVLASLRDQRAVALTLGADASLIFRRIVLPQTIAPACFIAGLSAFWSWGDFGLSRVVAERDVTVALTVQSLMSSYRLDLALVLTWVILIGGAATFLIFEGAARVLGPKPQA